MKDDLISRKALEEWVHANVPADTPDALITKSFVMAALRTKSIMPSVPSVPLDKLCEWLGKVAIVRCRECSEKCCNGEICCSSDHWRKEITKWMEGLDDHR